MIHFDLKILKFLKKTKELPYSNDRKSYARLEKDDQGTVSIYFNELEANSTIGTYQYDSKGAFEKIGKPKDLNEKLKKYTLFEWAIENHDFIDSEECLFRIRRNENDPTKEIFNEVLILPQIVIHEKGIVEILKHEKDEIVNDDLICKLYESDIFTDSNNPDKDIYYGKYSKYEIPNLIRALNQITGKFVFLTKYLKNNGDTVLKGEEVVEVKGGNKDHIYFTFNLKSKATGIIEFAKSVTRFYIHELKQKELLYIIYKDEEIRFNSKYFNRPLIFTDDFSGNKTIKWEIVGGYKFPYNSNIQCPIGGIISNSEAGKDLIFSFENHDGRDYLVLIFFSNAYNLSSSDKLYFMFDDDEVIEFEIIEKPYKSSYNWKNLYETKISITESELLKFKKNKLIKWKIELISQKEKVIGVGGNEWYNGENYYKVINNLVNDYIELVRSEIKNYSPLTEKLLKSVIDIKDMGECHVYLMIDRTNNFHKIGISNIPIYREKTLQSDKPTIELICSKKFPIRKIAEILEKTLHSTYSEKRIRGEWFNLSEKEINEIRETLR